MTRRGPLHPTPDAMTRPEAADERPAAAGIGSRPSDGGDRIDVATWSGSVPAATGSAPRVRVGSRWFSRYTGANSGSHGQSSA
jgi:methionine sulfoxide reductase catalytic subunit